MSYAPHESAPRTGSSGLPTSDDRRSQGPVGPAGPVRTCIGCRERVPRSDLVRLVVRQDGAPALVVDAACRMPGRGAWLHPRVRCLELAERRHAFTRALRHSGPLDTDDVRRFVAEHQE
ncbi:hypothetical protein CLV34_0242 [Luteimicrobium subarcticum]|uniref:YlxR domain-containing protein n=2 Tax=Luteimicrobium subarcticum TaxID=620910 RepID=A0A2M8WU69_9MICO|nr:YlxR family protein [Luteimicrobium subarcticum]PJI94406.1 hypothetical protein CLV34_0242 [Luteimicrobium subarcticum]